jgi:hypothetical protein
MLKLMALMVAVTFLNMSFILAEVAILQLDKNCQLIQNLVKNGIEEEKENGGESNESDGKVKETDLSIEENLKHHGIVYINGQQRDKHLGNLTVSTGFTESFFTPPERL